MAVFGAVLTFVHWGGIVAYCRPENKVRLGLVVGLNNMIRALQRSAYGCCDEAHQRLISAGFLSPLPENTRVPNSDPRCAKKKAGR